MAEIEIERWEIFANGLDHPECLAFERDGHIWAGGEAGQIYRITPDSIVSQVASMGGFCGGVARTPDDSELFVCNPQHGIVRVKRSGDWSVFAAGTASHKLLAPNYGLFDRAGNYYVTDSGTFRKRNGWLLRFSPDGLGEIIAGPFGYANGLALSSDETTLFMAETDTNHVLRIDIATGHSAIYAEDVGRMPDGLALDVDGNLYTTCYASDDIHKIAPDGSKSIYAWDPCAILLSRPTNIEFRDGYIYAANLGRTTITRAHVGVKGRPLANAC